MMRGKWPLVSVLLLGLMLGATAGLSMAQRRESEGGAGPQALIGTGFTYQGKLNRGGSPYTGQCDFKFSLHTAASNGGQLGITQTITAVNVHAGLFSVAVNSEGEFGDSPFSDEARWLAIGVHCAGDGGYTGLSPRQALTPAPYALALPGLWTEQNSGTPNIVGGYGGNSVSGEFIGAAIGGGGSVIGANWVQGDYCTVGGGESNAAVGSWATVSGGSDNLASGTAATVDGGKSNATNGDEASIGGGASNRASGVGATIGGGRRNTAKGLGATVPGGQYAVASHYGEMAYASGAFDESGDAQASVYVMRIERTCVAGEWYDLYLDGNSALPENYLTIASDRTVVFSALIVGRSKDTDHNESAGYQLYGVVENEGGAASLVDTILVPIGEDDSAWHVRAQLLGDALFIQVQGNGETIRWVASVRTAEVTW